MAGFIEKHSVWSDEQRRLAAQLGARIRSANLRLIRLAWADPHGASRAKAVTVPVFLDALKNGYNINVATTTLDSAGGRVFASFTPGGGKGYELPAGETRLFAGWNAHRLARSGAGWQILVKQINLIDCDQNLRNPSLLL